MENSTHNGRITDDPQVQLLQDPHDLPNLNKNNQIKAFSKHQFTKKSLKLKPNFWAFPKLQTHNPNYPQTVLISKNNPKIMRIYIYRNDKIRIQIMKSQKYPQSSKLGLFAYVHQN